MHIMTQYMTLPISDHLLAKINFVVDHLRQIHKILGDLNCT